MIAFIALQIISTTDCSFETAFEKGQSDIETKSYGANVDRFCSGSDSVSRDNFPKYYELGRQYGPNLKNAQIRTLPKDQAELDVLLKDAALTMTTKEIVDRMAKAPAASSAPATDDKKLEDLIKRIDALEAENQRLKEALQTK